MTEPVKAWTTDPPTVPGWYWQRWTTVGAECVWLHPDTGLFHTAFGAPPAPPSAFKGSQWWGPIEEPK